MLDEQMQIALRRADARRLLRVLIGCELALLLAYIVIQALHDRVVWGPLSLMFDLDREQTIPAWFSSLQLFAIGGLLLMLSRSIAGARLLLTVGGLGFVFLSADEVAGLHEYFNVYAERGEMKSLIALGFSGHGIWIVPYLALTAALVLALLRPILALWRKYPAACRCVTIGFLIMVGAIGFEVFGYYYNMAGGPRFGYLVAVGCEEFCEMLGASVVLFGVLRLAIDARAVASIPKVSAGAGLGQMPVAPRA